MATTKGASKEETKDEQPKVQVHTMVVYIGPNDAHVIEPGDWSTNQGFDGPRLVFHAGNRWMIDAKEVGLTDDHLDYFENDDDAFTVLKSDEAKFAQLYTRAKAKRRTTQYSGVLAGRVAMAGDDLQARDDIVLGHSGPAVVPGVTDTRPAGEGPMFEQPVQEEEPAGPTAEAMIIQPEKGK